MLSDKVLKSNLKTWRILWRRLRMEIRVTTRLALQSFEQPAWIHGVDNQPMDRYSCRVFKQRGVGGLDSKDKLQGGHSRPDWSNNANQYSSPSRCTIHRVRHKGSGWRERRIKLESSNDRTMISLTLYVLFSHPSYQSISKLVSCGKYQWRSSYGRNTREPS